MLLEAILFSVIPTKEITINSSGINYLSKDFFKGEKLKNTDYNKVGIDESKVGFIKSSVDLNELHILLKDVKWIKREKTIGLQRTYRGRISYRIYYKINYINNPNQSLKKFQNEITMNSEIISYSFKPGQGILSFIIGFVDTAYLINAKDDFTSDIEEIVRKNKIVEHIEQFKTKIILYFEQDSQESS
ncbi:hypothetical protein [Moorena sp. SIO3I8]|uniref:hypothetical protein n=1 Tax=Moorena sp. SIO3I8 TaxID=2607833 RepID=UPI0013C04659|nr:hypothetical protein [Moorena sp. SIO3I8]NEO05305.1 hypothetical protein [Moorena sp. SIO3I8]